MQRIGETELVEAVCQPLLVCPSAEAVDCDCGLADRLNTSENSFALLCPDDIAQQAAEVPDVLAFGTILMDRRCVSHSGHPILVGTCLIRVRPCRSMLARL